MASRRGFFSYDPYDYYYPSSSPYAYSYPYYAQPQPPEPLFYYPHHRRPSSSSHPTQPARNHHVGVTEPMPRRERTGSSKTPFRVEVTGPDPDPPAPKRRAPSPSAEQAALRLQAAARGLMARKTVREVRAVEREAEAVAARVAAHSDALRSSPRARVGVNEELMRLLLRLDGVRGAREYRRRVARRVLALQDAVDALDTTPPPVVTTDAPEAGRDAEQEAEDGTGMALELPVDEASFTQEENAPAAETRASMEVDGVSPAPSVVVGDGEDDHQIKPELAAEGEKAAEEEGEWEMVATGGDSDVSNGEEAPASIKGQAGEEKKTEVAFASAADGLDAKKLMEMVAALCERSAQQCALIGALAERVDTLERAVRRVEEADRRRRRTNKINKETKKKIAKSFFYSD